MRSLITDDTGAVVGIHAQRGSDVVRIRARKGVLLAAGGFEHNGEMRKHFLREGGKDNYSAGSPDNTGDGITAGQAGGGARGLTHGTRRRPGVEGADGAANV